MLRNSASGPEIGLPGRISAGSFLGKAPADVTGGGQPELWVVRLGEDPGCFSDLAWPTKTENSQILVAVKPLGNILILVVIVCCFWSLVWPKLAPGPLQTGQARKIMQNACKISPVDQV